MGNVLHKHSSTINLIQKKASEGIAKLHLGPNSRFFRAGRFFANCLHSTMYVNLRKTACAKKSSNLVPKASFAIPSIPKTLKKLEFGGVGSAANFLSSLAPCTPTMVARSRQKNLRSRLAKFQLFECFRYNES